MLPISESPLLQSSIHIICPRLHHAWVPKPTLGLYAVTVLTDRWHLYDGYRTLTVGTWKKKKERYEVLLWRSLYDLPRKHGRRQRHRSTRWLVTDHHTKKPRAWHFLLSSNSSQVPTAQNFVAFYRSQFCSSFLIEQSFYIVPVVPSFTLECGSVLNKVLIISKSGKVECHWQWLPFLIVRQSRVSLSLANGQPLALAWQSSSKKFRSWYLSQPPLTRSIGLN